VVNARARVLAAALSLFSFRALAAITGTVINENGEAVRGASVSAFAVETTDQQRERMLLADPARKPLATVQTDAKGNFSIDVKVPVADLRIEAAGQAPITERVAANEDAGVLQIGVVSLKQGTITANGKPLAGAIVIVNGDSVITTDAAGRYALPDPKRAASRIIVRHPDYALAERTVAPFLSTKIDFALSRGTPLTGRVVAADGETAVADAIIEIDDMPVTRSAADGTFSIGHAPRAKQIVARSEHRIAIGAGPTLRLAKSATLTGTIRDAKTSLPLPNVEVRANTPRVSRTAASALTDVKGNYAISGLPGGEYELTAVHPAYAIPILPIDVTAGAAAHKILYAAPLGRITGSVIDEDQRGVSGVRLSARLINAEPAPVRRSVLRTQRAITAPDGRFLVRVDSEGELRLDAAKKGLPPAHSATVRIGAGERKSGVTILLPGGIALTGRVVDRDAKPIAGARVTASESKPDGAGARSTMMNSLTGDSGDDLVRTAADGTFSLRVQEGTYDVLVLASGYAPKSLRAQSVSASSKPLEVTLEPGVEITGRVTRAGTPVEGVTIFTIGDEAGAPVQTGSDGAFRIADLAPGETMLAFRKSDAFIQFTRAITAPASNVEIELAAGGRVSGRVIDKTTHEPVKAFEAGISLPRGGVFAPPAMHAFAGDDGVFSIDGVPPGAQTLVVRAPGYMIARVPDVKADSDAVEVALESGVRLSGHVTSGAAGSQPAGPQPAGPVAGALVRIEARAALSDHYTLTEPSGEYVLENVEPGETTIVFSRSGLLPAQKTVTLSGTTAEVDAQLTAGASITGVVVDAGGAPVADARVVATSAAESGFAQSTQTDGGGAFTIDGAAPGHYAIQATKSGYADAVLHDVDITTAGALRLVLNGGSVITGRVTGLTPSELRSTSVQAFSPEGSGSSAVDDRGEYRIDGAPAGTVRVSARCSLASTSMRNAPMKSVQVDPGATVHVDFDFGSAITVNGRVTRGGAPVPGAMIAFYPKGAAQRSARTSADGGGRYEITGIDEGPYTVSVTDTEHAPYSTTFEVSGSSTFDIDMRGATLTGRVTDEGSGAAIANANIDLRRTGASEVLFVRSSLSDASGGFSFDQLSDGAYEASARKPGYGGATVPVAITAGGAPPVEVKLTPSPGLTLRVVDARDQRPLTAWYHAASSSGVYDGSISGAEPLRIALSAGSYRVTVGAPGYASRTFTISVPGDETVALTPGGTIVVSSTSDEFTHARLLDAFGEPYRFGPGPSSGTLRIDPAPGQTHIANVAAGNYTLEIVDDRGKVLRMTQVTVGEGQVTPARL